MLVLEDDAFLSSDVPCQLKVLEKLENIDYVNLEARGKDQKKCVSKNIKETICDASLLRLYQGRSGSAAYILWPSGAKKLLAKMEKRGAGIADKFINSDYSLLAYQVEPASVIQLDKCEHYGLVSPIQVDTSITNAKATVSLNANKYLKYRLKRLYGEFKIGLNQLRNRRHFTRRPIVLSDKFKPDLNQNSSET
jgi:glycosyl transferase family 25